ncbi:hypothetical protein BsWGS_26413 [Bradybaena similaris]
MMSTILSRYVPHLAQHSPAVTTLTSCHNTHQLSQHSPAVTTLTSCHNTHQLSQHSPVVTTLTSCHNTHQLSQLQCFTSYKAANETKTASSLVGHQLLVPEPFSKPRD